MTAQRPPFGVPGPPAAVYRDYGGVLVLEVQGNEAAMRRWRLALKACELIAKDRHDIERQAEADRARFGTREFMRFLVDSMRKAGK